MKSTRFMEGKNPLQLHECSVFPDRVISLTQYRQPSHSPAPKAHFSLPDVHGPSGVCVSLTRKIQERLGSAGSQWEVAATRSFRKWTSGKWQDYAGKHNERAEAICNIQGL